MRRDIKEFLLDAHIGRRIRRRREGMRLTLTGLAAATGISAEHLARLESGFTQAAPQELAVVAGALAAKLSYFFQDFGSERGYWDEREHLVIAHFWGVPFLPILVMERLRLIEKHGRQLGVDLRVSYVKSESAQKIAGALLSGRAQVAATGVPTFLELWAKTRDTVAVGALCALSNAPLYLISRNSNVRSMRDFRPGDRIGVRPGRASVPAVLLRMAAAEEFGRRNHGALDPITVPIDRQKAPEAVASGAVINADLNFAPHSYAELRDPNARVVMRSDEVLGGPSTHNLLFTTLAYQQEKPAIVEAVLAASMEALGRIERERGAAFETYAQSVPHGQRWLLRRLTEDGEVGFGPVPCGLPKYGRFMHSIGMIDAAPASEAECFLPTEGMRRRV